MQLSQGCRWAVLTVAALLSSGGVGMSDRQAGFDADPHWDGHNNRSTTPAPRTVVQDFGYSHTSHAGGGVGEMGGLITPDGSPAYYAKKIPTRTLRDSLSASGTLACTGHEFHALIGFFNAGTINEWRTPNSIALRIYGRGSLFYAYVEYTTGRWRAGGDSPGGFATVRDQTTGRTQMRGFATEGAVHTWSLRYDPSGHGGDGAITVKLDGETAICYLDPGHKADGAAFNRFGLLNVVKSVDGGGEIWLDDVTVNGETERFTRDPRWDHLNNRRTYQSASVRPRFDFGYSPTQFAKGKHRGELGGLVYRGDNRDPNKMAYYGDRLDVLTLDRPLRASGKVCLRRGVSDSTTLIGFFHSTESMAVGQDQKQAIPNCFMGIAIEGPSREGFLFYPTYGTKGDGRPNGLPAGATHILPDGTAHDWTFEYVPTHDGGRITVTLDRSSVSIPVETAHKAQGGLFNRFGLITTWIDGNSQQVYFDDLNYTGSQE